MITRCVWADGPDAVMRTYHDEEWGNPQHDDRKLFELLTLEGAQAGLSWRTVLARRTAYCSAFLQYEIPRVAAMTDTTLDGLIANSALIRNRLKIYSVRDNARTALTVIEQHGSLDAYLWSFVDGAPVTNRWTTASQVPVTTNLSDTMSKALRKRGFRFVGSTICYAFMQATGMVNDHLTTCFRHGQ